MQAKSKNRGLKKKAAAVVSVALALAIAFGSTYAWRDYSQHKTNQLKNTLPKYETVLVEDFQEKDDWTTADGELKKEISVKNTGVAANGYVETYARIQLKEYLEITPMIIEQTEERYMIDTAGEYIVFDTQEEAETAYPEHTVAELTDAVSGVSGFFVQTKEHDDNGQYGKFVTTKYELSDEVQHIAGDTRYENEPADNHQVKPNGECTYPVRLWEDGSDNPAAEYVKWVLNSDDVVLLSEWDGEPGPFWIIDDTADNDNPWIYWGEALYPGVETADFLKAVELLKQPNGDFYYALHTELEALSLDELFGEDPQWPDAPAGIKTSYQENAPQVLLIEKESGEAAETSYIIKQGETLAFDAVVKPDSASQDVAWSVSPANGTVSTENGSFFVTGEKPGTVTVKATAENGKYATVKVTVTNEKTSWRQLQDLLAEVNKLDSEDYTPESWSSLETALALAAPLTNDSDDVVIQAVIQAIEAAVDDLEEIITPTESLQDAIDAGKAILGLPRDKGADHSASGNGSANPYTPDSLDALQDAVEAAEELLLQEPAASNEDLEAAEQAIEDAISGLQNKADKGALDSLLSTANALEEEDYTTSTWGPFETALAEANDIYSDPNATASEVSDAIAALEEALADLEERGDTSVLDALISAAQAKTPEANFTAETWTALQEALTAATEALANNGADDLTQEQIDGLAGALDDALDVLVDLSELKAVIASAAALVEDNYTPDTWSALQTALSTANTAATPSENKTQADVNSAKSGLETAIDSLAPIGTQAGLSDAINSLYAANEGDYTSASWTSSNYAQKLADAQALRSPATPTPKQIADAIAALQTAHGQLVERGDPTTLNVRVNEIKAENLTEVDYTTGTWSALQTAITNAGDGSMAAKPDKSAAELTALLDAVNAARANLIDRSALASAIASATAATTGKDSDDYSAGWSAYTSALATAVSVLANGNATAQQISDATSALNSAVAGLVLKPNVSAFTVKAGSSAGGTQYQAATSSNFTVGLQKNASSTQTVYLTGAVTGTNLSNDPGQTTWSKTSGQDWLQTAGNSTAVSVVVPANTTGTIVVKAAAKDDSSKTLNITINVIDYTLFYSEGNMTYGATSNDATHSTATAFTINLTSPVGGATERYFTTSDTSSKTPTISDTDGSHDATFTTVTTNKVYKVSIPVDFVGTATFTVGSYVVTFNVTADVAPASTLNAGETFEADGIEWRVLMKDGNNSLVIAEHVLSSRMFHSTTPYPKWSASEIRTYLNDSSSGFLSTLNTLSSKAIEKTLTTRTERYSTGGTLNETTNDKVFLLNIEEAFYAGTDSAAVGSYASTGTADVRTNGNTVIFADANARKASYIANPDGGTSSFWWLRSPSSSTGTNNASVVSLSSGGVYNYDVNYSRGVRPALWLNLES
jgi:hypothetical protein